MRANILKIKEKDVELRITNKEFGQLTIHTLENSVSFYTST